MSGPEVLFQDLRRDEIRGWWWWWWWTAHTQTQTDTERQRLTE